MYNIERGRGPIIGDIINSSKFSDSQQDFLLGDEKFNFISRRIDDVSEGIVIKCYQADRLKSNASQKDINCRHLIIASRSKRIFISFSDA